MEDFRWSMTPRSASLNSTVIAPRRPPTLLKILSLAVQWNKDLGTQEPENLYLPKFIATNKKEPVPFTYRTMAFDESTFVVKTKAKLGSASARPITRRTRRTMRSPLTSILLRAAEAKPALKLYGCEGEWLPSRDSGGSGHHRRRRQD